MRFQNRASTCGRDKRSLIVRSGHCTWFPFMSLTLASLLSVGMRASRLGMASNLWQAWRRNIHHVFIQLCYGGIGLVDLASVLVFFWSACLWNFRFCFMGPRILYISIPRDVYEDDAHIYLHIYVSRKRGNP